ncbi:MAG TPA: hypothetical protein VEO91_11485 [Candidatus Limnocylindria bacterium]|nr:hypothetical protein [Candidatus Limnocylindria bacterium]
MQTIEGHLAAIAWRQYGTDASWDDVVTFFDAELRNRGWQEGGCASGFPSTDEWAVMIWHSDSRILRLGHLIDERAVKHDQQFVTVYAGGAHWRGYRPAVSGASDAGCSHRGTDELGAPLNGASRHRERDTNRPASLADMGGDRRPRRV